MSSRRLAPGLTLAALLLLPAYAMAADPPPAAKAEAAKLAIDGRKALKEKRFDEAAQALQRSADLDPNPQTRLDLAEALAASGKLLEASRALHAVADAPANPATTKLQEAAKKSLGEIEPRIPWLQIDIIGPDEGTAAVKVDGAEVDVSAEIPLNPGDHTIAATAEGFDPAEKKVHIEEGVHDKKKVKLHKAGTGKSKEDKDKDEGGSSSSGSSSRSSMSVFDPEHPKFPAVLSLGVGGVSLIVGTITGFVAISKTSAARKYCTGNNCTPAAADDISAAKAAGNASTATLIIGGVGVAAGAALFFILPEPKKHASTKPTKDTKEPTKEPTEAPAEPTEAFIAPYVGFGNIGVRGAF